MKMRRIISILLSIVMIFYSFPTRVFAFDAESPDSTEYSLYNSVELQVGSEDTGNEPMITIDRETAVSSIMGDGVVANNIVFTGNQQQLGFFHADENMKLPFDQGIVLSTGSVYSVFGGAGSSNGNGSGHPWLTEMYQASGFSGVTNDAAVLEFTLVPTSPFMSFDYFFASTEYNQSAQFNDLFALWIIDDMGTEDPSDDERFNIALLPNGNHVSIQTTVNRTDGYVDYTTSGMYFNPVFNSSLNGYAFNCNGYTPQLTADASNLRNSKGEQVVQVGKPVQLCLAIADASDSAYDSVVFIKSNSLNYASKHQNISYQPSLRTTAVNYIDETAYVEGNKFFSSVEGVEYQWYICTENSNYIALDGENEDIFNVPVDLSEGTYYFKCVVSKGEEQYSSNIMTLIVLPQNEYENIYTVTFLGCGDMSHIKNIPSIFSVEKGENICEILQPSHDLYSFGGWFTDSEYENPFDFSAAITSDMLLYAKWDQILESIEIVSPPEKTTYYEGDILSLYGIKVVAYYRDGTHSDVSDKITTSLSEPLTHSHKQVVLSYTENGVTKTAIQEIFVKINSPGDFVTIYPLHEQNDVAISTVFSWGVSERASYYNVFVWEEGMAKPYYPNYSYLAETTLIISLKYGTTYHFLVQAVNEGGSKWCEEVTFTTISGPNLAVKEVNVPAEVYAGDNLSVTWVIENCGGLSTGSAQWSDIVYVTSSETLDMENILMEQAYSNISYLDVGESYQGEATIQIPRGTSGPYYVFVVTNKYREVYDGVSSDNMVRSSAVNILLPPTPDLVVTDVKTASVYGSVIGSYASKTNIISDSQLSVKWTVENMGIEISEGASWADAIMLRSQDGSQEYLLGTVWISADKASSGFYHENGNYTAHKTVHIPENVFGEWTIVVVSDYNNRVYENIEGNNDGESSLNVTLNPPADLKPQGILLPDYVTSGEEFVISWKDINAGVKSVNGKSWRDNIYISQSETFDPQTARYWTSLHGKADQENSVQITLPISYKGDYYIHIVTDCYHDVFEYETYDNNVLTHKVSVTQGKLADLTVKDVTVSGTAYVDETIVVSYSVQNIGEGKTSSSSWSDKIYLVDESGKEVYLTSVSHFGHLEANELYTISKEVKIPSVVSGQYTILVKTNIGTSVVESYDMNNSSHSDALTVNEKRNVALSISDVTVEASGFQMNDTVSITYTVKNDGDFPAKNILDAIVLSTSPDKITNAVNLVTKPHDGLDAGESYTETLTAVLPATIGGGTYYIFIVTNSNHSIWEADYGNNMTNISSLNSDYCYIQPLSDLAVTEINVADTADSGKEFEISYTVQNQSSTVTYVNSWTDHIYLVEDGETDLQNAVLLKEISVIDKVLGNKEYQKTVTVTIPNGISGTYRICVISDVNNRNNESNIENNQNDSADIYITRSPCADLAIEIISISETAYAAQPFEITYQVTNQGQAAAEGEWKDFVFCGNQSVLSLPNVCSLKPGESYTATCTVVLSSYFLGTCTIEMTCNSFSSIYEENRTNNVSAGKTISLLPLPPRDLTVANVQAPASAVPGETVTVSWDVINLSTMALNAVVVDNVYISARSTWDSSAILVTKYERKLHLEASESDYSTVAFEMLDYATLSKLTEQATDKLPGVESGEYYIIVRTDVKNQITEPNENNNAATSGIVDVSVKNVYIGTPFTTSVPSYGEQYYKFRTEANKALYISLDSVTENSKMEFYVGAGRVPSASDYDYKYSGQNIDETGLAIPITQSGEYYLYVRNIDGTAITNYTLNITDMKFGVKYVTPNYGAKGKVTIKLTGAMMDADIEAYLEQAGRSIKAEALYYMDSSNVYATFDLTYASYGAYDLKVMSKDGNSVVEDAFEVRDLPKGELGIRVNISTSIMAGWTGFGTITYVNEGYTDVYAPILYIDSENLTFKPSDMDEFIENDLFFAENQRGLAGILAHGEGGTYSFVYRSNTIGQYTMNVYDYADFTSDEEQKPLTSESTAEEMMAYNLSQLLGKDGAAYSKNIALMASYLQQFGNTENELSFLESAYYNNALGSLLGTVMTSSTDLSADGITLDRSFSNDIEDKNTVGIFGKGWLTSYDMKASYFEEDKDKFILVNTSSGPMIFQPNEEGVFTDIAYGKATADYQDGAITVQDASGTKFSFDEDGNLTEFCDIYQNKINLTYTDGKLTTISSEYDTITLEYTDGKVTKASSSLDTVTYQYADDYLVSVTGMYGTVSYEYDTEAIGAKRGTLTKITYLDGTHQYYTYDELGRITSSYIDDGLEKTSYMYDGINQVTVVDSTGNSAKYYYDAYGLAVRMITSDGSVQHITYNEDLMLEEIAYGIALKVRYEYNEGGFISAAVSPDGQKTKYTYDTFGNITSITDKNGIVTKYERDAFGNTTKIVYDNGSVESYTYDVKGNVETYTDQSGNVTTYTYNEKSDILSITYADGSILSYEYDENGNISKVNDAGKITEFTYNEKRELTKITYPDGQSVNYVYDAYGRTLSITDGEGDGSYYAYDAYGRLHTLSGKNGVETTYTYHMDSTLAKAEHSNGTYTVYTYENGYVKSIYNYAKDGAVMSYFTYTYDTLGQVSSMETEEGIWYYEYDLNGQLIKAIDPKGNETSYRYDLSGNRTEVTENGVTTEYTANRMNQYTKVGNVKFTYDQNGNMTSMTDENGIVTTYGYDKLNRLISVDIAGGSSYTYGYDVFGLRNSVTKDGVTTTYLNVPDGYGDAITSTTNGEKSIYLQGNGLEAVQMNGNSYFYSYNHLGSTIDITDPLGNIVNSYSYDQNGLVTQRKETIENPYTYVGQYGIADDENGLFYMRARFVSQTTGAFMTIDPLGQTADLNVYRYAGNNTVMMVDLTGELSIGSLGRNIGKNLGGVVKKGTNKVEKEITEKAIQDKSIYDDFMKKSAQNEEGRKKAVEKKLSDDAIEEIQRDHKKHIDMLFSHPSANAGALFMTSLLAPELVYNTLSALVDAGYFAASLVIPNIMQQLRDNGKVDWYSQDTWNDIGGLLDATGILSLFQNQFNAAGKWIGNRIGELIYGNPKISPAGTRSGQAYASCDPNDILGPDGYGDAKWIRAEETLAYTIRFENDPVFATAPVQRLVVTQTLDENIDIRSFRLMSFGFGEYTFEVPENTALYQTRLDMREDLGLYIDVFAGVDVINQTVTYTFTAIDPETGEVPSNPFIGFLPVNNEEHIGEGFISYTVKLNDDIATGTQVKAKAKIVFDYNEAIDTPEIFNTVDADAPTTVLAEAVKIDGGKVKLTWSSADGELQSGIQAVDIYVSKNNGSFEVWKENVLSDVEYFDAEDGVLYAFTIRAKDNAGNLEPFKNIPEKTYDTGYTPTKPTAPTISILSHNGENALISITAENNVDIFYTLDGTMPTTSSAKYNGVITTPMGATVNAIVVNAEQVVSDVISMTSTHTPGAEADCTHDQTCTVCGTVLMEKKGHIPGEAANCQHDQKCIVCGEVLVTRKGHTPSAEATCTHDQICTVCGEVLVEKKGHIPGEPADCTNDQTCTICGMVLVNKKGHTPKKINDYTHDQICTVCGTILVDKTDHVLGAEATCTRDQTCMICGIVLVEKKGHIPGESADCTHDQTCTVCGTVLVEKKAHTPGEAANCQHDQKCTVCGTVLAEKTAHIPGVEADCTHDQICTVCEIVLVNRIGHHFSDWSVTKEPTTTEKGEMSRTCQCGAMETKSIDKLTEENKEIEDKLTGIKVTIPNGTVSSDIQLHADNMTNNMTEQECKNFEDAIKNLDERGEITSIWDISLKSQNETIDIDETFQIEIPISNIHTEIKYDRYKVVSFDENGEAHEVCDATVKDDTLVFFASDEYTRYGIVGIHDRNEEDPAKSSNVAVWIAALSALVLVGMVGTGIVIFKKKKM